MPSYPAELEQFAKDLRNILGPNFKVELSWNVIQKKFTIVTTTQIMGRPHEVPTFFPAGMTPAEYSVIVLQAFDRAQGRLMGNEAEVKEKQHKLILPDDVEYIH